MEASHMKRLLILLLALALFGCSTSKIDEQERTVAAKRIENHKFIFLEDTVAEGNDESTNGTSEDDQDDDTTPSSNNGSNSGGGKNNPQPNPNPNPSPNPSPDPQPNPNPNPQPNPEPEPPKQACPGGKYPDKPCDYIADNNYYYDTFSSEASANAEGQRIMDEVEYLNGLEITNYSVQAVKRNDGSIAHYGLNLWSDGKLIK